MSNVWRNVKRYPNGYTVRGLTVVRWESGIFFSNSKGFERQVKELVAQAQPKPNWLVLNAEATADADFKIGQDRIFPSVDAALKAYLTAYPQAEAATPRKDP